MSLAPLGLLRGFWVAFGAMADLQGRAKFFRTGFVRSFAMNVSHASWVSLLADIIPLDLRRFYVTQRMLAITIAGALGAPIVGFGIRVIGGVGGFQVLFAESVAIRLPTEERPVC